MVQNPLSDNRLRKMCEQKGTKSVLDYIKANSGKEDKAGGKGKKGKKAAQENVDNDVDEMCQSLKIMGFSEEFPEIAIDDEVKEVTIITTSSYNAMHRVALAIFNYNSTNCLIDLNFTY